MPSSRPRVAPPRPRRQSKFALIVWFWIGGICLTALVATYMTFVEPPPPRKIVIASGGKTGAYYHFANRYAEELRKVGLSVEVRETAGSVENLRLLGQDDSGVSVAIVQSGVAGPEDVNQFAALGSLYREPLWIFYRGGKTIDRIAQLEGKRVGIGPEGSGTNAIAMRMLAVNNLDRTDGSTSTPRITMVKDSVAKAATSLQNGDLNAAFFVAAFEADYISKLLNDPAVSLMTFDQQEAYRRRFRFLSPVTLPAGLVNLSANVPGKDIALLAPTAMLVVRKDFHPAFVPLLLATATRIHGAGDELSEPGEFPSESYCDFPVDDEARRFYKSGQPVLQRLLPFWLASLADRAKVMLIPLVMLMMPLLRATPPLMRWRTRRKIYLWYSVLREIDQNLVMGLSGSDLEHELARLRDIEHQLAFVDVPLSYMEECYQLQLHLGMLKQKLLELQSRS
ncbi:TAXI family TRAP transporter solute-binding subunit [Singulisphaera sp. PoT]|uniref:TAXI family TRAP transporter solute-binding subunit n=1 Tax=Singulisphaera sp. PoT TaxID=3411797 RepID=UPI003BF60218